MHIGAQKPYNYYNYTASKLKPPPAPNNKKYPNETEKGEVGHAQTQKISYIPKPIHNNMMLMNSKKLYQTSGNSQKLSSSNTKMSPYTELLYNKQPDINKADLNNPSNIINQKPNSNQNQNPSKSIFKHNLKKLSSLTSKTLREPMK